MRAGRKAADSRRRGRSRGAANGRAAVIQIVRFRKSSATSVSDYLAGTICDYARRSCEALISSRCLTSRRALAEVKFIFLSGLRTRALGTATRAVGRVSDLRAL